MKKYRVGDVSKFFGISKDAVRYYDEKNIVTSHRDENGYRYYMREELITMAYVITLKKLNMPLKEIRMFLNQNSLERSIEMIEEQEKKVDMQIKALQESKGIIRDYRLSLRTVQTYNNKVIIKDSPTIIYKEILCNDMLSVLEDFKKISLNHTKLFTFIIDKDLFLSEEFLLPNEVKNKFRYALSMKDDDNVAEKIDVQEKGFEVIKSTKCLYSVVELYANCDYNNIMNLRDYILKSKFEIEGNILLRTISLRNNLQNNLDYYEVWIPLEQR